MCNGCNTDPTSTVKSNEPNEPNESNRSFAARVLDAGAVLRICVRFLLLGVLRVRNMLVLVR